MACLTGFYAGERDSTTETIMANALQQNLHQLRTRVQAGPVGVFFRWWFGELKQAMPASWRAKLQHAMRRVTLMLDGESLIVGTDENRRVSRLDHFPLSEDTELQRQRIDDLLNRSELQEAPRFLLLKQGSVLSKEIKLPLAAEANLAQVLAFEMDRQTPFKAAGVYFDWQVLDRTSSPGQMLLQLFVVPRPEVERAFDVLERRGLALSGIDVVDDARSLGLNLLPAERRVRVVNRRGRLNLALGLACLILLAAVMAQSLYLRAHQVSELEAAIADVQGEARKVTNIRKQIEDTSEAAGFLATRRAESPLAIELLADVTRLLPDDTYLDRLVIGEGSVQMQGKSRNAQQLIERVNTSELLTAAAFRGSTRLDARTGLEIFELNATVTKRGDG
jgi:general secretion pathway protein L